jgi:hypothetical protein
MPMLLGRHIFGSDRLFNFSQVIAHRVRRRKAGMSTRRCHSDSDVKVALFSNTRECDNSSELVILEPGY